MASSSLVPRSDSQAGMASTAAVLSRRVYVWMLVLTIITGLEMGLLFLDISPILPLVRQRYGVSYVAAGWAISATIVFHTLSVAFSGLIAGRVGPRVLLISGTAFLAVSSIMRALAPSFLALIISRAVTGAGTGCIVIGGITAITLLSPHHRRVRDQGYFGGAQQLGIMLASLAVPIGVQTFGIPMFWGLLTSQLVLVLIACVVWYPRFHPQPVSAQRARPLTALRDGYGWLLAIANMAGYSVFVGVTAWAASFLVERYHTSPSQTALLLSIATFFSVVGRVAASPLLRVIHVHWLVGGFVAFTSLSIAAVPFAPNQQIATLLLLTFALGSSVPFGAIFGSIATRRAPAGIAARIMLITINSNIVALTLPVLIGYIAALTHNFNAGFWFVAAFTGLAAVIVLRSSLGRDPAVPGKAQASVTG